MNACLLAIALCLPQSGDTTPLAEMRKHAVVLRTLEPNQSLKDLSPLKKSLAKANVVGLGECSHGSHEVFQMKARLVRFLVEELGYTVLAFESNMANTISMDRYVMSGVGKPEDVTVEQGFWTWSTEEVRDMLVWIRKYNQNPKHKKKVRIVGIDAQEPFPVWQYLVNAFMAAGLSDEAVTDIYWFYRQRYEKKTYRIHQKVEELGKAGEAKLKERFGLQYPIFLRLREALKQAFMLSRYESLREDLNEYGDSLGSIGDSVINGASELAKNPALSAETKKVVESIPELAKSKTFKGIPIAPLTNAIEELEKIAGDNQTIQKTIRVLKVIAAVAELEEMPSQNIRDLSMAQNIQWIHKEFAPGEKVIYWAFNSHVAKFFMRGVPLFAGAHLAQMPDLNYYSLGFAFYDGEIRAYPAVQTEETTGLQTFKLPPAIPESFDAQLQSVGKPLFFLDFSGMSKEGISWLKNSRLWRGVGSNYNPKAPEKYYEKLTIGVLHDGILFISRLTPSRMLKEWDKKR